MGDGQGLDEATILDLVHESIFTCDADGKVLSWNPACRLLYGWTAEEAAGQLADALLATRYPVPVEEVRRSLERSGRWEGEVMRDSRAGRPLWVDARLSAQRDGDGRIVRLIEAGRDVTRRREAEEALRLNEFRYRNMFQAMAVSFWEIDFTGVGAMLIPLRDQGVTDLRAFLLADREFTRKTMTCARVLDVNDKSIALFAGGDRDAIIGGDITRYWPEASEEVYVEALVATMERRPHLVTETRLLTLDGREIDVLFTVSWSPESRTRGVVLLGIVDIADRVRAEQALQRVQAEFAHAARISTLGQLTASIAHEVNQPLAAIATNGEASLRWLARETPDIEEVRALSSRVVADARRAADIIARIRTMAEPRDARRAPLSLNEVVDEAAMFMRHELQRHQVRLVLELAPALPPLSADRTQLQQVLVNLAINAIQAMEPVEQDRRILAFRTSTAAAGAIRLVVEDQGPGIGVGQIGRLFDSFFTTKASGMGIGLPICRSILESHGGRIEAENRADGGGARFIVTLPADGS